MPGFCTSPGVVRQFVAAALGEGKTVEEQLTGKAEKGGIQFDIMPAFPLTPMMYSIKDDGLAALEPTEPFPSDSVVRCCL